MSRSAYMYDEQRNEYAWRVSIVRVTTVFTCRIHSRMIPSSFRQRIQVWHHSYITLRLIESPLIPIRAT